MNSTLKIDWLEVAIHQPHLSWHSLPFYLRSQSGVRLAFKDTHCVRLRIPNPHDDATDEEIIHELRQRTWKAHECLGSAVPASVCRIDLAFDQETDTVTPACERLLLDRQRFKHHFNPDGTQGCTWGTRRRRQTVCYDRRSAPHEPSSKFRIESRYSGDAIRGLAGSNHAADFGPNTLDALRNDAWQVIAYVTGGGIRPLSPRTPDKETPEELTRRHEVRTLKAAAMACRDARTAAEIMKRVAILSQAHADAIAPRTLTGDVPA